MKELKNCGKLKSPASFSWLMDYVMREIEGVLTYINDVLAHARGYEDHCKLAGDSIVVPKEIRPKAEHGKDNHGAGKVQYFGYTFNKVEVSPSQDKLKEIRDSKTPSNVKQIREFAGLANYFLIPDSPLCEEGSPDDKANGEGHRMVYRCHAERGS